MITEFDGFENFIAVYCKIDGKPDLLIQDLNSKKVEALKITDDVGDILPMVNDDYHSDKVNFLFSSPFVYQKQYLYRHI